MKKALRIMALTLALLCMCLMIAACSSEYDDGYEGAATSNNDIHSNLVYTVTLNLRYEDVKGAYRAINSAVKSVGGYATELDESYSNGKCTSVDVTYYIPTQRLDEVLDYCESNAEVAYKDVSATEPSPSYSDLEARLAALKDKKEALEELLDKEDATVNEKTSLIEQISSVASEIADLESDINQIKAKSEYSTLELYISQPDTFFDVFMPIFVFLILPPVIFCAIFFSIRGTKKRNRKLMQEQEKTQAEEKKPE